MDNKTKLGALFYPKIDQSGNIIPFDSLFIPHIYREIYFDKVYDDILKDKKDLTIIDVGSNIGVTVQFFQPYAKKLYAIEPSPEHVLALKQNKEFNNWDNVEVHNVALADKDGEMNFSQNIHNRTSNSLAVSDNPEDTAEIRHEKGLAGTIGKHGYTDYIKVQAQSIDHFFEENNIEHVDFMKFDPEGAEDMIMRSEGFKKVVDKIDSILVEFHFHNWKELVEYLKTFGFKTKRYESDAKIVLFYR
jgi:FkbM family methyltransferase